MTPSHVRQDSFILVTPICAMTPSYIRHDIYIYIYITWFLHLCHMTPSYMWYDSFICAIRLLFISVTPMCDMTYAWHDSFRSLVTYRIHQYERATYIFTRVPAHGGDQTHKFFGSRDLSVFLLDLLSDGDSVYSTETDFGILGTPLKTCLICMGIPGETC